MPTSRQPFKNLEKAVPKFNINKNNTALLISDLQILTADKKGSLFKKAQLRGIETEFNYYFKKIELIKPKIKILYNFFSQLKCIIIFTRYNNILNRQNKVKGFYIKDHDLNFIKDIQPKEKDIIINKICDNPFNCTEIDNLLKNNKIINLIICGVRTPGYLNNIALDAADRGYSVLVVSDACGGGIEGGTRYITGGIIKNMKTEDITNYIWEL